MKLLKVTADREPKLEKASFSIHKTSDRIKPKAEDILIVSSFSEFGCEILTSLYCLPRIKRDYPDKYIIVAGWFGRKYLYQHLVDEFWELGEEYQYLRDYTYAFHHKSKVLESIEKRLSEIAPSIFAKTLGNEVVGAHCLDCKRCWASLSFSNKCQFCQSTNVVQSLFSDIEKAKKSRVLLPQPSESAFQSVKSFIGPRPVGIFARGRKTYGRNLSVEFYIDLINNLESRGYTPIWLGEKQSTLPCPLNHVHDFSRNPMSRDLELTLAIVKQCEFTIQFWTASTRLASLVETPYVLFESPSQITGNGHEGKRLALTDTAKSKLIVTNYINFADDLNSGKSLVDQALDEIEVNNWNRITR